LLLRNRRLAGLKFRRQHSVGPYVVDFFCHGARLAVEVDGGVHDDLARAAYDAERQRMLEGSGLRVVRVSNVEVLGQPETVLARIIEAARPHPGPLPGGEGGA
jgi:very-short-patch-repair endonuclease